MGSCNHSGNSSPPLIFSSAPPSLKMFSRFQQPLAIVGRQLSTSSANNTAVAVMGASGGIGQPLSMLLKLNPAVTKLNLYDIVNTPVLPLTCHTLRPRLPPLGLLELTSSR